MSECDNCNRYYTTCSSCPYYEKPKTLAEMFAENLEIGWDYAIEELELHEVDCEIREAIEIYWHAYEHMENADPDDGKCYKLRAYAIKEIQKRLEKIQ